MPWSRSSTGSGPEDAVVFAGMIAAPEGAVVFAEMITAPEGAVVFVGVFAAPRKGAVVLTLRRSRQPLEVGTSPASTRVANSVVPPVAKTRAWPTQSSRSIRPAKARKDPAHFTFSGVQAAI